MAPTLGYWKIRGLAQPIRLILGYTGTEFNDVYYELGDGPEFNADCWLSVKYTLGLDFPNLPYFLDGDVKITQSNAFAGGRPSCADYVHMCPNANERIMRYIGRKNSLDGKTEAEKVKVDIMENQAMDFRNGFTRLCYNRANYENELPNYKKNVQKLLKMFDTVLSKTTFFVSNELTFVDFIMYELLDQHRIFDASLLQSHENIKAFLSRFEAIPAVAEFMKSDKCFKGPINNKSAKFK